MSHSGPSEQGPSEQGPSAQAAPPWWHGAVIYQLYVRSWRDSDGDGYGDLRGIIERLDHLAWLGVDAVWLSPTMPSPDEDWGYDVSDYTGVHPELGTLAGLDELIAQAGRRGMRVLLDLVPNHTSSAHPWFADAASGREAAHRSYYVWADGKPDGGPPNNWLDFTGRPAWQWHESGQYYLHNFLPGQPDLNWWEPAVHAEFRRILEFWFDRGVAGFRVDVANGLYKDAELRDNPPLENGNPMEGAYGLRFVYNTNRPETHGVYRDWRKIAESYSPARLLLGETWVPDAERLAAYYGDHDELQLGFNFPFAFASFDPDRLAQIVEWTLAALPPGACPVWMGSNHDLGRFPSRWCGGDERKTRLALLVMATLPGTSVLYYGDEIGMTDVDVPVALRRDNATLDVAQGADSGNRDRARTPMPWDGSPGGGFTGAGVTPWLPLGTPPLGSVADQRDDPDSVLSLSRALLALRRAELGGGVAEFENLHVDDGQWVYRAGPLVVAGNFTGQPAGLPAGEVLLRSGPADDAPPGVLRPWEGVITRPAR
ncbi:MAG TPA: alpha-amylase family glycosyl hydrolase [Streptosporangiaceae bacterium]|nr:alpha-amylase family glycosyl hydrolase [Streptosporangiaceae bacterium]